MKDSLHMKFIADGMLGGLAKWLRLMGYDTLYFSARRKSDMLNSARREDRIILTRDTKLSHDNPGITIFIENDGTHRQLKEVRLKLSLQLNPEVLFTRCSLCNSPLEEKNKTDVKDIIPEFVYENREKFRRCPSCKRVYWDGDHCKSIRSTLQSP